MFNFLPKSTANIYVILVSIIKAKCNEFIVTVLLVRFNECSANLCATATDAGAVVLFAFGDNYGGNMHSVYCEFNAIVHISLKRAHNAETPDQIADAQFFMWLCE